MIHISYHIYKYIYIYRERERDVCIRVHDIMDVNSTRNACGVEDVWHVGRLRVHVNGCVDAYVYVTCTYVRTNTYTVCVCIHA